MSFIRPPGAPETTVPTAQDATVVVIPVAPARRLPLGRSVAVLLLVAIAALIPLLGPSAVLEGTGEAVAPAAGTVGLLRAVVFAALCVQAGELYAARLARAVPDAPRDAAPRSWSAVAAGAGFLASLALAAIVANGNLVPERIGDLKFGELYGTSDGMIALLEVNAFAAAGLCALSSRPARAAIPLAALVVAEALRAHPEVDTPLIGSALTLVHLTCAAMWVGGLFQVLRVLRRWRGAGAREPGAVLLARYARAAGWLFAAMTTTGLLSTLRRMPPDTVLDQLATTGYGRTLLAKVLLVAVVAVLALLARRRSVRATDPAAAFAPARAEVVVLGVVVAVSALLTAVPVPIRW